MRKFFCLFFIGLLIFLSFILSGCGDLTETGNPRKKIFDGTVDDTTETTSAPASPAKDDGDDGDSAQPIMAQPVYTDIILQAMCSTVDACYENFSQDTCLNFLDTDTNAMETMGVDTSVYSSFTEVQVAIDAKELEVSSSEVTACEEAIVAVSCDTQDDLGVFADGDAGDYSRVYLVIPEDGC